MDNFSREDIFNLWIMTCAWVGNNPQDKPSALLQDKLKNMLDNYCEHDYKTLIGGQTGGNDIKQCKKCLSVNYTRKT